MESYDYQEYPTLQHVPFPKGHVYLYAPNGAADVYKALRERAMEVIEVKHTPLMAQTGYQMVAVGDNEALSQAKHMALQYHLPLWCVPTDYGCTDALSPYVATLCPTPDVQTVEMHAVAVQDRMDKQAGLSSLYAFLFGRYVAVFDEIVEALWQNQPTEQKKALGLRLRSALCSPATARDATALWALAKEATVRPNFALDWYAQLLALSKEGAKAPFALSVCMAQAVRLAPNVPPIGVPPNRGAVLCQLAQMGITAHPVRLCGKEHLRRDWIWLSAKKLAASYFDCIDAICAQYRLLLPNCGWQENPDLDAWDLLQLLPMVAELCYDTSTLGHLYCLGDFNTWIA